MSKLVVLLLLVASTSCTSREKRWQEQAANKRDWQFVALIVFGKDNFAKYAHCLGALIKSNFVLTSASSMRQEVINTLENDFGRIGVRLGTEDLIFIDQREINPHMENKTIQAISYNDKVARVEYIKRDPNYAILSDHSDYTIHDLAIVKINYENPHVRLPMLPERPTKKYEAELTIKCKTCGWNINNTEPFLKEVKFNSVTFQSNCCSVASNEIPDIYQREVYFSKKFCSIHVKEKSINHWKKGNPTICFGQQLFVAMDEFRDNMGNIIYTFEDIFFHLYWINNVIECNCVTCDHKTTVSDFDDKNSSEHSGTTKFYFHIYYCFFTILLLLSSFLR